MALTTLADYKVFAGIASVDATRDAALTATITQVERAIKDLVFSFLLEPVTITDEVLNAPLTEDLYLTHRPVRSVTSVYVNPAANGEVAAFTAADLLTNYDDYILDIDRPVDGISWKGRLIRRGGGGWWYGGVGGAWGAEARRPVGRLGHTVVPGVKCVKVTYAAGLSSVPDSVKQAVYLSTAMVYARRQQGAPVTSSSWNGASFSLAGPFTTTASFVSPDAMQLLIPYGAGRIHVG